MNENKLRPWKTLSRSTILDHGKFLVVENHTIELPDGEIIEDWPWIIIPSAAIVLAVTAEGEFLCFRQTKYAVDGTSLAPVGGMIEPGEEPPELWRCCPQCCREPGAAVRPLPIDRRRWQ